MEKVEFYRCLGVALAKRIPELEKESQAEADAKTRSGGKDHWRGQQFAFGTLRKFIDETARKEGITLTPTTTAAPRATNGACSPDALTKE